MVDRRSGSTVVPPSLLFAEQFRELWLDGIGPQLIALGREVQVVGMISAGSAPSPVWAQRDPDAPGALLSIGKSGRV